MWRGRDPNAQWIKTSGPVWRHWFSEKCCARRGMKGRRVIGFGVQGRSQNIYKRWQWRSVWPASSLSLLTWSCWGNIERPLPPPYNTGLGMHQWTRRSLDETSYFIRHGCRTTPFRPNLHSKQPDLKCISLAGLDSKYSFSGVNYTFPRRTVAKHKMSQLFYRNPSRVEERAWGI